jgi:hypothetical protein
LLVKHEKLIKNSVSKEYYTQLDAMLKAHIKEFRDLQAQSTAWSDITTNPPMTIEQVETKEMRMQDDIRMFTKAVIELEKNPKEAKSKCVIF